MRTPRIRMLRVYYAHHPKRFGKYPVIRIGGEYLKRYGFGIGDKLEVKIGHHHVSITKCKAK